MHLATGWRPARHLEPYADQLIKEDGQEREVETGDQNG